MTTTRHRRTDVPRARGTAVVLGGIGMPLVSLFLLALAVGPLGADELDRRILAFSDRHLYDQGVARVADMTLYATVGVIVVATVVGGVVFASRRAWRQVAFLALAVGGVFVLDPLLKALVQRPPLGPHSDEFSFPSGTAMLVATATVAAGIVVPQLMRVVVVTGVCLALVTGVALTYTWWHYPTDVLAGWCAGIALAGSASLVVRQASRRDANARRL
jgi:membrane-associated phospholipid phosphatase